MTRSQNARLLVTEGDRLVGIVTLKSLMNYLNAKLDLERADLVDLRPRRAGPGWRAQPAGIAGALATAANRRSGTSAPSARTGVFSGLDR